MYQVVNSQNKQAIIPFLGTETEARSFTDQIPVMIHDLNHEEKQAFFNNLYDAARTLSQEDPTQNKHLRKVALIAVLALKLPLSAPSALSDLCRAIDNETVFCSIRGQGILKLNLLDPAKATEYVEGVQARDAIPFASHTAKLSLHASDTDKAFAYAEGIQHEATTLGLRFGEGRLFSLDTVTSLLEVIENQNFIILCQKLGEQLPDLQAGIAAICNDANRTPQTKVAELQVLFIANPEVFQQMIRLTFLESLTRVPLSFVQPILNAVFFPQA
jgi:hypothetical protein